MLLTEARRSSEYAHRPAKKDTGSISSRCAACSGPIPVSCHAAAGCHAENRLRNISTACGKPSARNRIHETETARKVSGTESSAGTGFFRAFSSRVSPP